MRMNMMAAVAALTIASAASAHAQLADFTVTPNDGNVAPTYSWQAPLVQPSQGGFYQVDKNGTTTGTFAYANGSGDAILGGGFCGVFCDYFTGWPDTTTASSTSYSYGQYQVVLTTSADGQGNVTLPHNLAETLTVAVPEPATWAMLILGLGAMGVVLRRRGRAAFAAA